MASQAEFEYCLAQWEEQKKEDEMEEEMEKEMLWEMLWEEFPQFQDDQLQDLLEKLCSHDCFSEGSLYLDERRSIMQAAAPLADAWESAEILKKIFKWGKIPRHFQAVIFFLEN